MATYKESSYRFTDPIRYFKENDPYYWEVDNIPIKQLEENILWLKDQVGTDPTTEEEIEATGVNRSDINELKPYVLDEDNIVYVKPGRYIARINDAYTLTPLQKLILISGNSLGSVDTFQTQYGVSSTTTNYAETLFQTIQSSVAEDALNLNGLIERITSWNGIFYNLNSIENYSSGHPDGQTVVDRWPLSELARTLNQFAGNLQRDSQELNNEFIKRFRGVARTAVVDIPETLNIEVPEFRSSDFYYDENGVRTLIAGATKRIDLLFVYSKPVDASATTLNKWSANQPQVITKPTLGLVIGAGVGVTKFSGANGTSFAEGLADTGDTQILAHIADENQTTNGFQALNVHGSFPSPDDLMNLAPIIQNKFEADDPRLIGQSILPLAYIVVKADATANSAGIPIITSADVIDIRPFLRTAELTYNERAGISAAVPGISLSNPVVSKQELDSREQVLKQYIDLRVDVLEADVLPRPVFKGTIWGGRWQGPEGQINKALQNTGANPRYSANEVPYFPDWDIADWWDIPLVLQELTGRGTKALDWLNSKYHNSAENGMDLLSTQDTNDDSNNDGAALLFVKKKFLVNRDQVPWMTDYAINLKYLNCVPMVNTNIEDSRLETTTKAGFSHFLIDKKYDNFTVYSFTVLHAGNAVKAPVSVGTSSVEDYRNRDSVFRKYAVTDPELTNFNYVAAQPSRTSVGGCVYPTVEYEIIGYPSSYLEGPRAQTLQNNILSAAQLGQNPTITLR